MKHAPLYGVLVGLVVVALINHCVPRQQGIVMELAPPIETHVLADALPSYEFFNEAAVHAALRAYQCSHVYECGGSIGKRPDGRFVVGRVDTSYNGDSLEAENVPGAPKGSELVAGFHAHPCLTKTHYTDFFSPNDIAASLHEAIPEVLLDQCSGKVHYFDPHTMPPETRQLEKGVDTTDGLVIGQITVDGVDVDPNTGL
jgi:hypothetical protein